MGVLVKLLRLSLAATALAFLPICASADVSRPGPDGTGIYSTGWSGGGRGSFHVVWRPALAADGTVLICGLWTLDNMRLQQGAQQILRGATVIVDGRPVRRSLTGLARAVTIKSLGNTEPACVPTEARGPWEEVEIAFGNGTFRN